MFDMAISSFYSVYNTSDHERICVKFKIESERFNTAARQFVPTAAWHKASGGVLSNYLETVTYNI